ncbi:MAG: HAMP domain-containing sensor histidine kinase [Myxococcota bacterium]
MAPPLAQDLLLILVRALRARDRPLVRQSAEMAVAQGISSELVEALFDLVDVTEPGRPHDEADRRLAALLNLPMVGEMDGRAIPLTEAADARVGIGFAGDLMSGVRAITGATENLDELEALLQEARLTGQSVRTLATPARRWRLAATHEEGEGLRVTAHAEVLDASREAEELATINHELTNGLTALASLAAMARQPSMDPHYVDDALRKIERTAVETVRSVKGTRQALQSAPPSLPPRSIELSPILIDLVENLEALAHARGVALERRIAVDLRTFARDTDLRSIVWNLLKNAIEAGGQRVRVGASEHGARIRVVVDDDGPGMSAEVQARAFEPYYTTKDGGTGLGLPLVRHLVERLGGELLVESEPGRGTRMVVALQRSDADHEEPSGVHQRPLHGVTAVLFGERAEGLRGPIVRAGAEVWDVRALLESGQRVRVAVLDGATARGPEGAILSGALRETADRTLWLGSPPADGRSHDGRLPRDAPLEDVFGTLRTLARDARATREG